ncbi:(2Fe-2S)-binding protein [Draconibacterium halophilum]|uniref:NAD(P)H-nitrite reductase n=1 Tax=Draconibacterium halophilum TaxID=2706887 RepID=A0A6C0RH48_9BACT|nr:(2Fe-2S)-binding protein [Draconibacterium halophilum]QIA08863.1 NAD(P)H-nitrite reductase [Draconibacterium halophilum]
MSKVICFCKNVSEAELIAATDKGAKSLQEIKDATGACTGSECKTPNPSRNCCADDIREILGEQDNEKPTCCCG